MFDIVTIAGSPSAVSRSAAVLKYVRDNIEEQGLRTSEINVRDLNPQEVFYGKFDGPTILHSKALLEQAHGVVIATPVYKAAYSGILKAFLDLLPQNALAGKTVLPIATGGSPAHLLAIDYALKPVLSSLGATHILSGVHILDSQLHFVENELFSLDEEAERRLNQSLYELTHHLHVDERSVFNAVS